MLATFVSIITVLGVTVVSFGPLMIANSNQTAPINIEAEAVETKVYPNNDASEYATFPLTEQERADGVLDEALWYSNLGKCLTDNNFVFYGMDTCPHCTDQKYTLSDGFRYVNYVECSVEKEKCAEAGISRVPTWVYPGGKKTGHLTTVELSELSGCY